MTRSEQPLGTFLAVLCDVSKKGELHSMAQGIQQADVDEVHARGRLLARPDSGTGDAPGGLRQLNLESERDGLLYVPRSYAPEIPTPLVLMLHGAGGTGRGSMGPLLPFADTFRFMLLAPDARLETWDVLRGGFGPDVEFIDRALGQTFSRYNVDSSRVAVGGFSDGASYALSIGLGNGDLVTNVIAFSPGFMAPNVLEGKPRIFISHGLHDRTLPIDLCSRRIVPSLRRSKYEVVYREFDGPHTVPESIASEATAWFAGQA